VIRLDNATGTPLVSNILHNEDGRHGLRPGADRALIALERRLTILVDPALTRGQPDERRPTRDVVPIEQPAQLALDRLDP
jgi:hypothetical protein